MGLDVCRKKQAKSARTVSYLEEALLLMLLTILPWHAAMQAESSRLGLSPSFLRDTATRMGSLCCAGHSARDDQGIERVARLPGAVLEAVQAAVAEEPGPAMAETSQGPVEACEVSGGGVIEKAEAAIRAQSMPRH